MTDSRDQFGNFEQNSDDGRYQRDGWSSGESQSQNSNHDASANDGAAGGYGNQPGYDPFQYGHSGEDQYSVGRSGMSGTGQGGWADRSHPNSQGEFQPWDVTGFAAGSNSSAAPGVAMPGGEEPPVNPVTEGSTKINIGEALSVAVTYLNRSLGSWIGMTLLLFVAMVIVTVGGGVLAVTSLGPENLEGLNSNAVPTAEEVGTLFSVIGFLLVGNLIVSFFMQVLLLRGGFEVVDGRSVAFGSFFKINRWGSLVGVYLVSAILSALAVLPGFVLVIIGATMVGNESAAGVAVLVFGYVVLLALAIFVQPLVSVMPMTVMDGRATALESPVVSWRLIKPQFWMMLLATIVVSIISAAGALLFYVGMIYTIPLAMIMQVHIYRQILGGRRVVQAPPVQQAPPQF